MECRILLSGAELDLFTLLAQQPLSAPEAANRIHADLRSITILMDALSAMGLLTQRVGTLQCPSAISALLSSDAPNTLLPWVLHMASVWKRWSSLTSIVQGSQQADHPVAPPQTPCDLRAFIGAMHVLAFPLAPRIVAAVDPYSSRALLDVGGAMGTYAVAFFRLSLKSRPPSFDRPEVLEIARHYLSKVELLHRVTLVPGTFTR